MDSTELRRAVERLPKDAALLSDMFSEDSAATPLEAAGMVARLKHHLEVIELFLGPGAQRAARSGFSTVSWHRGRSP